MPISRSHCEPTQETNETTLVHTSSVKALHLALCVTWVFSGVHSHCHVHIRSYKHHVLPLFMISLTHDGVSMASCLQLPHESRSPQS